MLFRSRRKEERGDEERRQRRGLTLLCLTLFLVFASGPAKEPNASYAWVFMRKDERVYAGIVLSEEGSAELADGGGRCQVTVFGEYVVILRGCAEEGKDEGWDRMG